MRGKKKTKIIIDTNLFISFFIGKRLSGLREALVHSSIELIFSEQNIEELKIVAARQKFNKYFAENDVADLINLISNIGRIIRITDEPMICRDPKDNFLLALADMSRAHYLVTGDADLLIIGEYKKTKIITGDQLENILSAQHEK